MSDQSQEVKVDKSLIFKTLFYLFSDCVLTPFGFIWAAKTLFGIEIPSNFETYTAVTVLLSILGLSKSELLNGRSND